MSETEIEIMRRVVANSGKIGEAFLPLGSYDPKYRLVELGYLKRIRRNTVTGDLFELTLKGAIWCKKNAIASE